MSALVIGPVPMSFAPDECMRASKSRPGSSTNETAQRSTKMRCCCAVLANSAQALSASVTHSCASFPSILKVVTRASFKTVMRNMGLLGQLDDEVHALGRNRKFLPVKLSERKGLSRVRWVLCVTSVFLLRPPILTAEFYQFVACNWVEHDAAAKGSFLAKPPAWHRI